MPQRPFNSALVFINVPVDLNAWQCEPVQYAKELLNGAKKCLQTSNWMHRRSGYFGSLCCPLFARLSDIDFQCDQVAYWERNSFCSQFPRSPMPSTARMLSGMSATRCVCRVLSRILMGYTAINLRHHAGYGSGIGFAGELRFSWVSQRCAHLAISLILLWLMRSLNIQLLSRLVCAFTGSYFRPPVHIATLLFDG